MQNRLLRIISSSNGDGGLLSIETNAYALRRDWKLSQMLLDSVWNHWAREYLPTLSKRSKWTNDSKPIALNDLVILVDDQAPRYSWKLVKINSGPHGRNRVVMSTRQHRNTKLQLLSIADGS